MDGGEYASARISRAKYAQPLVAYVKVYGTCLRVIKGWIAIGKKADPPVLPPLDDPEAMVAWWPNHMQTRVPEKILAPARGLKPGVEGNDEESVDVDAIDASDFDALASARRYLKATERKLAKAYRLGDRAGIKSLQQALLEGIDAERKLNDAVLRARKSSEDYIARVEVLNEISQLLEVFRQMRSTMRRRIAKHLQDLPPEVVLRVGDVVELERESEDSVLRQLKGFRGLQDVELELEAV